MRARCQSGQGSIPIPIPTPIQTMVWWIGNHCLNSIDERERICGLHQTTNLLGALGVLAVPLVRGPWQLLNTAPMELRPPRSLRASSPSGSEDLFGRGGSTRQTHPHLPGRLHAPGGYRPCPSAGGHFTHWNCIGKSLIAAQHLLATRILATLTFV